VPLEWREHAAAVVVALQLKDGERERLGAYFTPPRLAAQVLRRLMTYGYKPDRHRIIDPAAGGAAFLAPLYGLIADASDGGFTRTSKGLELLDGIEIDRRLANVSTDLLAWRLAALRGTEKPNKADFATARRRVVVADTLKIAPRADYDVVVGNPPYARIGKDRYEEFVERWPSLTDKGGYLNLSMAFVCHCLAFLKPGGLLSFVMPAGFIGGPSFRAFRKSIASDVVAIDRLEKREGVFLDVIQDCVILTMKRRCSQRHSVPVSNLAGDGSETHLGRLRLPISGGPWQLPNGRTIATGKSLSDLGWKGKVGAVVPHRWKERVFSERRTGSVPLVWAAAIRPDGRVDYDHMRKRVSGCRALVDPEVSYIVRRPCVLVQRTSNRKQMRRINAAVVDRRVLDAIGPFVTENHVIVLTPPLRCSSMQNLRNMTRVLNSSETTAIYDRIGGTANVSLKILLSMKLPIVEE